MRTHRGGVRLGIAPVASQDPFGGHIRDDHLHATYRSYGVVADVGSAAGLAPCPTASVNNSSSIDEAEVVY